MLMSLDDRNSHKIDKRNVDGTYVFKRTGSEFLREKKGKIWDQYLKY